ncbi:hypothetical protein HYFRA_00013131 [Hymenoscyphus fraxineus]|uniref:Uncharacterized protein n=1 Tax=Hymenoscyphus fraxineus TaxID=746836 RepID=A0A9N9L678_9HELO|nr:hypothetical protein HYFRA_00013131 [Hymenoscyphus fraxineus]
MSQMADKRRGHAEPYWENLLKLVHVGFAADDLESLSAERLGEILKAWNTLHETRLNFMIAQSDLTSINPKSMGSKDTATQKLAEANDAFEAAKTEWEGVEKVLYHTRHAQSKERECTDSGTEPSRDNDNLSNTDNMAALATPPTSGMTFANDNQLRPSGPRRTLGGSLKRGTSQLKKRLTGKK